MLQEPYKDKKYIRHEKAINHLRKINDLAKMRYCVPQKGFFLKTNKDILKFYQSGNASILSSQNLGLV